MHCYIRKKKKEEAVRTTALCKFVKCYKIYVFDVATLQCAFTDCQFYLTSERC